VAGAPNLSPSYAGHLYGIEVLSQVPLLQSPSSFLDEVGPARESIAGREHARLYVISGCSLSASYAAILKPLMGEDQEQSISVCSCQGVPPSDPVSAPSDCRRKREGPTATRTPDRSHTLDHPAKYKGRPEGA
jgi:hypothetical protein